MTPRLVKRLVCAAIAALLLCSMALAQGAVEAQTAATANTPKASLDKTLSNENNWYFSWGYSRQQYAPSDIHVSQPSLGNDFTVRQAAAGDFPGTLQQAIDATVALDFTLPQENVRIGKYMNPEKTFAIEFSLDHSKYNTDLYQTAQVVGTVNGQPYNANLVLAPETFFYALHNGLNHVMVNAVWLHHLLGPEKQPGDLQLISRAGAGILLPHADNTIFGKENQVGPKNKNVCCFSSNDWWQLNGWTAGVEVGVRYTVYKSIYLELTSKWAYGALNRVPVYQGFADQKIWMTEQVLSTGFHF
jgi:hypothetical protein